MMVTWVFPIVISWSKSAFVILTWILVGFLAGTVPRNMSRLLAVEAKSFPKIFTLFFIAHCIDCGGDDIDIHSIWVMLSLIVSSLIGWSRCVSLSIDLSKFVGVTLLSSHWFV